MNLADLVGNHYLSGVEHGNETYKDYYNDEDDRQYILFVLDDITYLANEDPDDGYRSYCNELEITDRHVTNRFSPIEVTCKMRPNDDYEVNDVLEIYDAITRKLIIALGTMNTDDYYPWCEFEYNPENMILNQLN